MISLEKWKILTSLQKLPTTVGNLGKIIVVICFEKLPKVQKISQSGHTVDESQVFFFVPVRGDQKLFELEGQTWASRKVKKSKIHTITSNNYFKICLFSSFSQYKDKYSAKFDYIKA